MAIAVGTDAEKFLPGSSWTLNVTIPSGGNGAVFVMLVFPNGMTSLKANGVDMTLLSSVIIPDPAFYFEAFFAIGLTGSVNVVWAGTGMYHFAAMPMSGVKQTLTPVETETFSSANPGTFTFSAADTQGIVIAGGANGGGISGTPSGFTMNLNDYGYGKAGYKLNPTATQSGSWSFASYAGSGWAFSFAPAPGKPFHTRVIGLPYAH